MSPKCLALLLGLAACGPSGIGPAAQSTPRVNQNLPEEDQRLDAALAMKRGGDPIGAWKLIENIPASSPARLDDRYNEVMSAYADARAHQIGVEIVGAKGGGPTGDGDNVKTAPSAPAELTDKKIDRFVNDKRASLRARCYGDRAAQVSFQLRLRIDTDGRVIESSLKDVRGDSVVAQCVRDESRSWVFPHSADGADHRTKFIFSK